MRLANRPEAVASGIIALFMAALLLASAFAGKPVAAAQKAVKLGYMAFSTGSVGDCGLPSPGGQDVSGKQY